MAEVTRKSPRRLGRIILVLSLALNLAFVGLIGGVLMRDQVGGPPRGGVEFGAGPLGRALSQDDRREIGRSIRDQMDTREGARPPRHFIRDMQTILRAPDLDVARLEEILAASVRRGQELQAAAQAALVERIADMSYEERVQYADRLKRRGSGRP